jgi:hypothetical protein
MGTHIVERRRQHLTARAVRAGQWLLPWACLMILSGTLAHAADEALTRTLREPASEPLPTTMNTLGPPASRWVSIAWVNAAGEPQSMKCFTTVDRVAVDVLYIDATDQHTVAVDLCSELWR